MRYAKEMITLIMRLLGRYREKPGSRQTREADQECGSNEPEKEGERGNPREQERKATRSLKHPSELKTAQQQDVRSCTGRQAYTSITR